MSDILFRCMGGIDSSDATATSSDILLGKTAYVNDEKIEGTIPSKTSQIYTPSRSNQTIASGQYLSGTQTIKGDSNLIASNIKKGVSIFGVSGSLEEFKNKGFIVGPYINGSETYTYFYYFGSDNKFHSIKSSIDNRYRPKKIICGNGVFVCLCSNSDNKFVISTDLIVWKNVYADASGYYGSYDIAYGNGRFVTVGNYYGYSLYSTDGITWNKMTGSYAPSTSINKVFFCKDRFIALGTSYNYYSTDGITWTKFTGLPNTGIGSMTYGNGKFIFVGSGTSYYSTDGITWTSLSELTAVSVAYGNGKFVAVGNSGTSYYSTDGITWTSLSGLNTSYNYYNIAYGNGKFVAITNRAGQHKYMNDGDTSWLSIASNYEQIDSSSYIEYCEY